MAQLIGFFSSDARPLYKEDIYRALALPSGSVIHFRYDQKYVQDDIVANPKKFIGKDGVIFFVTGNDLSIADEKRQKHTYSIRKVKLKGVSRSDNTRQFHFFLQLEDYCDCTIISTESSKFVSSVTINEGTESRWIERVKAVKDNFGDILFFRYDVANRRGKKIRPKYSKSSQDAVFKLWDEGEYRLDLSFFDKRNGISTLDINSSEDISVHYRECSKLGSVVDDRQFRLHTGCINHLRKPEVLKLKPLPNESKELDYEVTSFFEIKKNVLRVWLLHRGKPVAVTTASHLIRGNVGGGLKQLTRENTIELSRLCAVRSGLCRIALRMWREFVFPDLPFDYAISYQDADLHNGNTYRFDGWKRIAYSHSGTDFRTGRRGRDKWVWAWHECSGELKALSNPSTKKPKSVHSIACSARSG